MDKLSVKLIFIIMIVLGTPVFAVTGTIQGDHMLQAAKDAGRVSRSNFTSEVKDHEPVDNLLSLSNQHTVVYYFSELLFLKDQRVTHRWEYNGKVIADVGFNIKGDRWRVWSKKTLLPNWIGVWRVSILNQDGQVLASSDLNYTDASQ